MRVCSKCDEVHPETFFNKDRTAPSGLYPQCKNCSRAACKRVYTKYHDRHVEMKRAWKAENPEKHAEINRAWQQTNPEKMRAYTKKWIAAHPEAAVKTNRLRRERLLRATPPWADREAIKAVYKNRPEGHDVDHIYPLAGENVSGLNVPWNLQYLPVKEHQKKGRKVLMQTGG